MIYGQTIAVECGTDSDSSENKAPFSDQFLTTPPQDRFRNRITDVEKCSMYFLAGAGLIKIGISTNIKSRIRAIRNSSPVPLEILAIMPRTGNVGEGFMHERFSGLRRHGEWFVDDGVIRAHIAMLIAAGKASAPA